MSDIILLLIVLFAPLIGGLTALVSRSAMSSIVGVGTSLIAALLLILNVQGPLTYEWSWVYELKLSVGVDKMGLILISLVNFVSLLVLVFSGKYMEHDDGKPRYFVLLCFFIFSMVGLLLAGHLLLLFVFWELVGLASYLLIGFWYQKPNVSRSARIAFMVNRAADACLLAGIMLLFKDDASLSVISASEEWPVLASFLVTIGAFGKSAQLPFSGWLLRAMVGPTPVSALIHAATMVAAGVYLLIRISDRLPDDVLHFIAIVGSLTAFYAAVCAIVQHDIKRILAFSTISQLGYMILGVGVGAVGSSLFHLITHAFFKAGLFLGAASVIHFVHARSADPQDMRHMGGLKEEIPWTFRSFVVCGLALAGLPLFSGFLSKDGIILSAWQFALEVGSWAYIVADLSIFVALLTSFYVGRMVLLVFFGQARSEQREPPGQESRRFYVPLIVLAIFSFWFIFNLNPLGHSSWLISFMDFHVSYVEESIIPFLSILMAIAGLTLAFSFFKPDSKYTTNYAASSKTSGVVLDGFRLEKIYSGVGKSTLHLSEALSYLERKVMDPLLHIGSILIVVFSKFLTLFDRFFVDGPINLVAFLSAFLGKRFAGLSSRDGQTQIIWLLVLVILILSCIVLF